MSTEYKCIIHYATYYLSCFLWVRNWDKAQCGWFVSAPVCLRSQQEDSKTGSWNLWKIHSLTCLVVHACYQRPWFFPTCISLCGLLIAKFGLPPSMVARLYRWSFQERVGGGRERERELVKAISFFWPSQNSHSFTSNVFYWWKQLQRCAQF